jgi:hypothetical protein
MFDAGNCETAGVQPVVSACPMKHGPNLYLQHCPTGSGVLTVC